MIRIFDFFFSLIGLVILFPVFILLLFLGLLDNGSPLFRQKRIGRNLKPFTLIKFRTMPINTKSLGTHLLKNLKLTSYGYFLRKTKLDEIPQLFNVLLGDMSFVGPRPCLLNQKKLINQRKKRGVLKVKPGITGLAQISGIGMNRPVLLSKTDSKMIKKMNLFYYFFFIFRTILLLVK